MSQARDLKVLTQAQHQQYLQDGYLSVEGFADGQWLQQLQGVTQEFVQASRQIEGKDARFDLEPDHCAEAPRIRRLISPVDQHQIYWAFASSSPIVDVAQDLLGPNVKFH